MIGEIKRFDPTTDLTEEGDICGTMVEVSSGAFVLHKDHVQAVEDRDLRVRMMLEAVAQTREHAAKIVLSKDKLTTCNAELNQEIARLMTRNNQQLRENYKLQGKVAKQAAAIRRLRKQIREAGR